MLSFQENGKLIEIPTSQALLLTMLMNPLKTSNRLATVADVSLSGTREPRELDRIAEVRGYPCMIVSDNGTELTSNAILEW